MEQEKNKNGVIALLVVIIVILLALVILFATGTINLSSKEGANNIQNDNTNTQEKTNTNSLSTICTADEYDSRYLKELVMENKTEKIAMVGGPGKGYNVTTTVTKQHNYNSTPENNELYTNDMMGTLYVLYKNKLYYTSQKDTISKYCQTNEVNGSTKLTCDYSKFSDDTMKEFNTISIDLNLKAIGSYGNAGSGSPTPYAITTDGKVINLPNASSQNYDSCGILYDNSEYPIDRIFNLYFYDGVEYTILLKNGTLITRDVDREHPIELEH